jgi:anti-anti-sigma factor
VALATSRATEELGCRPERIEAYLSANILKNAMGVGIPGTGMVGLPIAIALGALIGRSEYGLEVLKNCTPEAVEEGKTFIKEELSGVDLLVLDLAKLKYTSSAGLRTIILAQKTMNKQGKMILKNVGEDIMDVFDMTGLLDLLTIE